MIKIISFILLGITSQCVLAQDIPDFSANYLVRLNGLQAGELKQSLSTNSDNVRVFKSTTQAKGVFAYFKPDLVEETSHWQYKNNAILPQSYLYQRTGGKKEKYLSLSFDWLNMQVFIDDKKQPWQLEIEKNTLDKLVYQLALMSDLAEHKTKLNYRIADGGKLKDYKINILGEELITTPLGNIHTIKLKRERTRSKGRETTLWCAPALNYLPVRLEHTEKGGTIFTAELRRLKGISIKNAFTPFRRHTDY
ncbi:MAG: DUF3108 domain-containing protein [Piscirickettsiaceae bacterium]|nr:DUF3108 domain-containing protein [Piscirickettsiaceae bacterium]